MAIAPTARPVTERTCRQLALRRADFLRNDFTFQSLFSEAAAGTATAPCHFSPSALKPPHATIARVPTEKDGVHWRKRRRRVKRLCVGSGTLVFTCNQIATERFHS